MEKEQVAVDEAVETVAEENTRAYSKTVWNESTPITADKLNKIEDGIASALPLTGGTLTGKIDVPGESTFYKGTYVDPWENTECVIKASGNVGIGGALKVNGKLEAGQAIKSPLLEATTDIIVNRYGFTTYYTNSEEGTFIFCNKNGSSITLKDNRMVYANPQGNLEIGPRNSHHCHFFTDRPAIQFNKDLFVNENKVYHAGNKPTAWDIGAMSSNGPSFSGNMIQAGPGGKDWIYHINADRGTLNIAPRNNGNPDWGKQIMFDRNGQMYCNGNRRVATINQENPAHHMIRYGAGMGGENGYITFSW